MSINILYHDVTAAGDEDASGFSGGEAAHYKLSVEHFAQHLKALERSTQTPPLASASAITPGIAAVNAWTITFDDGGASSATVIADQLERHGWRGWFFIPTDYIGRSTFCNIEDIRRLHRRGHVVGSHTCSHPERFSSCTWEQMLEEWTRSCRILAQIVGEPVTVASVPGGFYSLQVARAASAANVRLLFNSEPTTAVRNVDDCLVVGRYSVVRGMGPMDAEALINSPHSRLRQAVSWNTKKAAKTLAGPFYKAIRTAILRRSHLF